MNVSGGSEIRRQESPERFLPLIFTAEMTLSHLCSAGDEDARALFRALGLNEDEIPDSPATILSPEQRLTRTVFLETRKCVTDALAELTEASLYADLPCGLSPRALRWARKERNYLGLDLPPFGLRRSRCLKRRSVPLFALQPQMLPIRMRSCGLWGLTAEKCV